MDPSLFRQRRRSNLGKRLHADRPQLVTAPTFPTSRIRGLGRGDRSAKKEQPRPVLSKPTPPLLSSVVNKRLFITSPCDTNTNQSESSACATFLKKNKEYQSYTPNLSLNETGVSIIKSPIDFGSKLTIGSLQLIQPQSPNVKYRGIYEELKPPVSPGPSRYDQMLRDELANLKPPVDPDELTERIPNMTISNHVDIDSFGNESSNNENELDTTHSFINAERTILDATEILENTRDNEFKKPFPSALKNKRLDSVVEENGCSDTDEEDLERVLENLNKMSTDINQLSKKVNFAIQSVQKVLKKKKTANKENLNSASVPKKHNKWMTELKADNPSLLKTPKVNKHRPSFMDQSILTPHSLSSVLTDQIVELFD